VLRYAIAFALRRSRKIMRGLNEGLTEEERYAVADHAVAQLNSIAPWLINGCDHTARKRHSQLRRSIGQSTEGDARSSLCTGMRRRGHQCPSPRNR